MRCFSTTSHIIRSDDVVANSVRLSFNRPESAVWIVGEEEEEEEEEEDEM